MNVLVQNIFASLAGSAVLGILLFIKVYAPCNELFIVMRLPKGAKLIPCYDGFYAATPRGVIWSCRYWGGNIRDRIGPWRRLALCPNKFGHLRVGLRHPGGKTGPVLVHRLILETFVGPCPIGYETRHLDSNPSNNHLSNLTWGTPKENQADKLIVGTDNRGERCGTSKMTWEIVLEMRRLYKTGGHSYTTLSLLFGFNHWTIADAIRGRTWTDENWDKPAWPRKRSAFRPWRRKNPSAYIQTL